MRKSRGRKGNDFNVSRKLAQQGADDAHGGVSKISNSYTTCMSNRDGILDSHPSERVKMPPELAAFDRWDADPNDLAKWEAAMAALAPAAGADNSNATVNL